MIYEKGTYLTDKLAVTAQLWTQDFRMAWGLDEDSPPNGLEQRTWELLKHLDQLAKNVVVASKTLVSGHSDPGRLITDLREWGLDVKGLPFFSQALEAHFAEDLEDELLNMRNRALRLVRFLVSISGERPRQYLARVGACYLRGLDTETVIMCGAVLDAALQELLSDADVRAEVNCRRNVSLGNRIEFMKLAGRWNPETAEAAQRVADDRNDAIHTRPELGRDATSVLQDLAYVLSELSGSN